MFDDWEWEEYWWYDKKWAVYEEYWFGELEFVGYCYGEYEARYMERRGFYVFEPARRSTWW